jgi:hypothetical protein
LTVNRKIVDKKEILRVRTVSNTGMYCSSDGFGAVYNKCSKIPRDELLVNILDVIAFLKGRQYALRRKTRQVLTRVAQCIDVDGGIFEHLL